MNRVFHQVVLALFLLPVVTGCAAQDERQMYAKASALTKLSAAVEATVLYRNSSADLTDQELLRLSTASDPALLQEFDTFILRVDRGTQAVTILVCGPDAGSALLEDASCTAKPDRHHWRDAPESPCSFTLKLHDVCTP